MSEVQKTSTWCLKRLYSTGGINRMWCGGVALAEISEILPCDNITFFPASCFLSALVVLVLLGRCGVHDIFFSLFTFYNCAMQPWFHDKIWFLNWVCWEDSQTEAFLHWYLMQCIPIQYSPADNDDWMNAWQRSWSTRS